MTQPSSELTDRERHMLNELWRRLEERLPALIAQWERIWDDLLDKEQLSTAAQLRDKSLQAAQALLHTLAAGDLLEQTDQGRSYGEAMARLGCGHILLTRWLSALRQSLLTTITGTYGDDPHLDQTIVAFSKFFAPYMLQVTESLSTHQQQLLLEQQAAVEEAYQASQRRVIELEVLNEIGRALSSVVDLDQLLEVIYQQTSRLMETSNFYIALCDWEQNLLHFMIDQEEGERRPPDTMPVERGLTGHIARSGEPLLFPHGPDAFLAQQGINRVGRPSLSWLGVPMVVQERVVGVIAVQSYDQQGAYDEEHLRVLLTIASQAAVAVENAHLYQQTRRRAEEMEALYRTGSTVASQLSQEEILQSIYEQAGVVMDTGAFYVALYDRERDEIAFELVYDKGERVEPFRVSRAEQQGLTGLLLDSGESILIRNWEQEASEEMRRVAIAMGEPIKSWLGVPMVARGEVIGAIAAQSYQAGAFDDHDRRVLEMVAHQATATIESARLYQEAHTRVAQLSALQQIGLKLASATELNEVLDSVAESAIELLSPSNVLIFLYDAAQDTFTLASGMNKEGERGLFSPMPRKDGLTATVARSGELIAIDDVPHDPLYVENPQQAGRLHSIASVPLIRSGDVLGVLNVSYHTPHRFSSEEKRLMKTFADYAAVAVANAHNFRQMQSIMQELHETAEVQSELLDLIQELSTPVVPLLEQVLLMPLVGSIDSQRGRQILDRLLHEVEVRQARVVLIDITGVPVVDTAVAQILLHTVKAVRLLGAEAVLVGITPEVAQTLVGLGVNLADVLTRSDLQSGVSYARRQIEPGSARATRPPRQA